MRGKVHFPTLSRRGINGKLVLQISVITDNYHIMLEGTHAKKEPSSHQLFHPVWSKTRDPKKSIPLLQWIPQDTKSGRPQRVPYFSGDGKVSKKHTYSCQQLSEIFKSSLSRVINIFHNHPKTVFPLHWNYCTWQGSSVTFFPQRLWSDKW